MQRIINLYRKIMDTLKFTNRLMNMSTMIIVDKNSITMNKILSKLKQQFNLSQTMPIKIFCIGKDRKPIYFEDDITTDNLIKTSKEIRQFDVYWKFSKHGKQTLDMTTSSPNSKTLVGYKRYVSSDKEAGDVTIGDPNGASIFIPAGALAQGSEISIKTITTDDPLICKNNVTRMVYNDPNKVNKQANK